MFEKMLIENEHKPKLCKGLLTFEDYNYKQFNENVFAIQKKENEDFEDEKNEEDDADENKETVDLTEEKQIPGSKRQKRA